MKACFLDTETTGLLKPHAALEYQPRIVEVGAVVLHDGVEVEGSELSILINPGIPIPPDATRISGITDAMVKDCPPFADCVEAIAKRMQGCEAIIAHNANFDVSMLRNELQRVGAFIELPPLQICTVEEFRHVFGRRAKLTELYERYVGKPLGQTHRALDDVRALIEALRAADYAL